MLHSSYEGVNDTIFGCRYVRDSNSSHGSIQDASSSHSSLRSLQESKAVSASSPTSPDLDKSASTLHDSYTTAKESPYSSTSSAKDVSPDADSSRWADYGINRLKYSSGDCDPPLYDNVEHTEYENAPVMYRRQNSEPSNHRMTHPERTETRTVRDNNDSSSSSEKMVFIEPVAHISSEANKLVVSKVETTKTRAMSDSGVPAAQTNAVDKKNISKRATVKEIRANSLESASAHEPDAEPIFVTPVMKRTSPQQAVIRQQSREGSLEPSSSSALEQVPESTNSSSDVRLVRDNSVATYTLSTEESKPEGTPEKDDSIKVTSAPLKQLSVTDESLFSSGDNSPIKSQSSVNSSLASLSNVVAPCGSTEDLDGDTSSPLQVTKTAEPAAELAAEPPKPTAETVKKESEFQSVLFPVGNDMITSDFVRDITSTLDEALSSMDEVMSGPSTESVSRADSLPLQESRGNDDRKTSVESVTQRHEQVITIATENTHGVMFTLQGTNETDKKVTAASSLSVCPFFPSAHCCSR